MIFFCEADCKVWQAATKPFFFCSSEMQQKRRKNSKTINVIIAHKMFHLFLHLPMWRKCNWIAAYVERAIEVNLILFIALALCSRWCLVSLVLLVVVHAKQLCRHIYNWLYQLREIKKKKILVTHSQLLLFRNVNNSSFVYIAITRTLHEINVVVV